VDLGIHDTLDVLCNHLTLGILSSPPFGLGQMGQDDFCAGMISLESYVT
jgi:hypothetical protein